MSNIAKLSVAAATAVAGYDMVDGDEKARVDYGRWLTRYGCTGSTAAGDFVVELRVGGKREITLQNTTTGVAVTRDHMLPCSVYVPKGRQVQAIVTDAANTNPVSLIMEFTP